MKLLEKLTLFSLLFLASFILLSGIHPFPSTRLFLSLLRREKNLGHLGGICLFSQSSIFFISSFLNPFSFSSLELNGIIFADYRFYSSFLNINLRPSWKLETTPVPCLATRYLQLFLFAAQFGRTVGKHISAASQILMLPGGRWIFTRRKNLPQRFTYARELLFFTPLFSFLFGLISFFISR